MSQDTRQPSADPQNTQKNGGQPRPQRVPWHRRIGRKVQAIPLSTKLVTCIIVLLTIGTIGISFSIRTLVGNYLLQKTDTQLVNQAQMIFNSMDSLDSTTSEDGRSLVNTYYVEVRDSEYKRTGAGSVPMLREGVVSEPSLPPTQYRRGHARRAVHHTGGGARYHQQGAGSCHHAGRTVAVACCGAALERENQNGAGQRQRRRVHRIVAE